MGTDSQPSAPRAVVSSRGEGGWPAAGARLIAIGLLYAVISGLVLGAFTQKWSFLEYCGRFGLQEMIEGTAERPFVYRQLMPTIVKSAEALIPDPVRETLLWHLKRNPRLTDYALFKPGERLSDACAAQASSAVADDNFRVRHALMYGLCYLAIFTTLWLMCALCRSLAPSDGWAWVWPILFFLALPYTFRLGGYFYDFGELLLLFTLLLLLMKDLALPFVLVLGLAVLNKESALIFPAMVGPLMLARFGRRTTAVVLVTCLIETVLLTAAVRDRYAGNPGEVRELHVLENVSFWLSAKPYTALGTHSAAFIPMPTGANVLLAAALGYAWWRFGRHAPQVYRRTMLLALALNVPLFLIFGLRDEVRNLSLAFPIFFLCLYAGWLAQQPAPPLTFTLGDPDPARRALPP